MLIKVIKSTNKKPCKQVNNKDTKVNEFEKNNKICYNNSIRSVGVIVPKIKVEKYNPYHDAQGKFTGPGGARAFSYSDKVKLKNGKVPEGVTVFTAGKNTKTTSIGGELKDGKLIPTAGGASEPKPIAEVERQVFEPKVKRNYKTMELKELTEKADKDFEKFDKKETSAVVNYTRDGYRNINWYLRKGQGEEPKTIRDLDSAMNKSSVARDTTVYRGASMSSLNDQVKKAINDFESGKIKFSEVKKIAKGGEIIDKGYMSTSTSMSVAHKLFGNFDNNIHCIINVPQGKKAIHVDGKSSIASEQEILLNRGSVGKIKNISQNKKNKGVYLIEMDIVG